MCISRRTGFASSAQLQPVALAIQQFLLIQQRAHSNSPPRSVVIPLLVSAAGQDLMKIPPFLCSNSSSSSSSNYLIKSSHPPHRVCPVFIESPVTFNISNQIVAKRQRSSGSEEGSKETFDKRIEIVSCC